MNSKDFEICTPFLGVGDPLACVMLIDYSTIKNPNCSIREYQSIIDKCALHRLFY